MEPHLKAGLALTWFARSIAEIYDGDQWIEDVLHFLAQLHGIQNKGYFFICWRNPKTGRWDEEAFVNQGKWQDVAQTLEAHPREKFDLYFSVNSFSKPCRLARYALPSCIAHADLDEASPHKQVPKPNIVLVTSPKRYQALWLYKNARKASDTELVSKQQVYKFGGDKGGWSSTKVLRLPFTYNHKPEYERPLVEIIKASKKRIEYWPRIEPLPSIQKAALNLDPLKHDWRSVVRKFKTQLSKSGSYSLAMSDRSFFGDRSQLIFKIVGSLHEAGATPDEIAAVLWRSPYFTSKYCHSGNRHTKLNEEISRILAKLGGAL